MVNVLRYGRMEIIFDKIKIEDEEHRFYNIDNDLVAIYISEGFRMKFVEILSKKYRIYEVEL